MMIKKRLISLLPILLLLLLTGCASYRVAEQPALTGKTVTLSAEQPLSQTFTPRFDGLDAIYIFLTPIEAGAGTIRLTLSDRSDPNRPLAQVALPLGDVQGPGFQRFDFPAIPDSTLVDFKLSLSVTGEGAVGVGIGDAASYEQGALYVNQRPTEAQMAFQLTYQTPRLGFGLFQETLRWSWWVLLAVIAFILPGWALLSGLWPGLKNLDTLTKVILSCGMSLSLYPLLMLWTSWLGFNPGRATLWGPLILAALFLLWRGRRGIQTWIIRPRESAEGLKATLRQQNWPMVLTQLLILALIFLVRFWHIRTIEIPLWGDSYHHTTIVQLILDRGGLFHSWLPYAPYQTYTTHFGFHANSAIFAWISGKGAPESTLIMGQLFNALAAISLYPLAKKFTSGETWAGIGTLLAAGLLSPMPAFYVNWGRYAQLPGQVLLPIAVVLLIEILQRARWRLPHALLTALTLAGMIISYYRTPIFFLAFVPTLIIIWIKTRPEQSALKRQMGMLFAAGLVMTLLLVPFIMRLMGGALVMRVGESAAAGDLWSGVLAELASWQSIRTLYPIGFLILAGVGWLLSLLRRDWRTATLPLGLFLVQSYLLGRLIGLPFAKFVQPFTIMIFAYLPLSPLIGTIPAFLKKWLPVCPHLILAGLLGLTALAGAWRMKNLVDTNTFALVTHPDQQAFHWIEENIPVEALFLVEGYLIYDNTTVVGGDGGWWIPLLTRRANTMPPQYALVNEKPITEGYSAWIVDIVKTLEGTSLADPESIQHLCDWGITHIYVGQKRGQAGLGAAPLFLPAEFESQPAFTQIYQEDRVRIFALDTDVCRAPGGE
jgi:hypothetical protein